MLNNKPLTLLSVTSFMFLGACQNYHDRVEGVTASVGNAQAINEVKLVEDTWKPSADNNQIDADGKRVSDAVNRYKNANDGQDGGTNPISSVVGASD